MREAQYAGKFRKANYSTSGNQTTVSHESSLSHPTSSQTSQWSRDSVLPSSPGSTWSQRRSHHIPDPPSAWFQSSLSPRPAARLSTSVRLRRPRGRADRLVCGVAVKRCRATGTSWGCGRCRPLATRAEEARPGPSARWLQVRGSRLDSGRSRPLLTPRRPRARRRWPAAPWGRR